MDDLIAFLAARLDEDEAAANKAAREVKAKRAILARGADPSPDAGLGEHLQRSQEQPGIGVALRLLAAVYSDHPGYRQEWKP